MELPPKKTQLTEEFWPLVSPHL